MATVFLAHDVRHERDVAIKVLHPELAASMGSERFDREIKLAAKLHHPHILSLFDSGSADGLFYYVMPFVQGESLRDRLDREQMLPVDDALQVLVEVADALGRGARARRRPPRHQAGEHPPRRAATASSPTSASAKARDARPARSSPRPAWRSARRRT